MSVDAPVVMEMINRRRRQIIVHSVLYYTFNTNLIDDHTFDTWCRELVHLQETYPDLAKRVEFHEDFKDFRGETGYQFAKNDWGMSKAMQLIRYEETKKEIK